MKVHKQVCQVLIPADQITITIIYFQQALYNFLHPHPSCSLIVYTTGCIFAFPTTLITFPVNYFPYSNQCIVSQDIIHWPKGLCLYMCFVWCRSMHACVHCTIRLSARGVHVFLSLGLSYTCSWWQLLRFSLQG